MGCGMKNAGLLTTANNLMPTKSNTGGTIIADSVFDIP